MRWVCHKMEREFLGLDDHFPYTNDTSWSSSARKDHANIITTASSQGNKPSPGEQQPGYYYHLICYLWKQSSRPIEL